MNIIKTLPCLILCFLVKTVPVGTERDIKDLHEHEVQIQAVERVQKCLVEMFNGVNDVFWRSDEDPSRFGEISLCRCVDNRSPLKVRL